MPEMVTAKGWPWEVGFSGETHAMQGDGCEGQGGEIHALDVAETQAGMRSKQCCPKA